MADATIAPAAAARPEAAWRRRFRATRLLFPQWARDDADRLVYLSNASGKFEVHAWDRRTGTHRPLTDRPEGTGYRVPARLEPDGRHVWWFDDRKGDELGRWVREPFEGGDRTTIAAALAPSYSAGLALADTFALLGRSRGDEGSTVYLVADGPPRLLYRHPQSAAIGDLSRDQRFVVLSHSEHGDSRNRALRVLRLPGGETEAELWDGPGKGLVAGDWSPVAGDERLLVGHDREGTRRYIVYDVAARIQTPIEVDLPGEVGLARWYPDARAILLLHEHRGRGELFRYEVATRGLEPVPTERGNIENARVRPDGSVWYFIDRSSERPAVHSTGGGVVLAPSDEAPGGVAYRDLDVDGIHGFVAEPQGATRPHPTLFYVHGGPEYHDSDAWSPTVQAWVDHGFAVVCLNYRGSTGYGKAWRDAIVGRPGLTELEDVAKVHEWAVGSGLADARRCVIGGGSWGGYLTLLALGTQPERWAAGIGIVPIGDYVAAFEDEMEPLKRYDAALFGGTPAEVPEAYRAANPITHVERVRAPMLLLVGQNDPRCPSRSVDVYVERLVALGKPFEEYRYDAGHGSLVIEEQLKQVAMQLDFVGRVLGKAHDG